tara:strand:- start:96 stop:455 length:360 start_codon:yes stop_codon:yes gene_type:complete
MKILSLILLILFSSCSDKKLDSEFNSKLDKSEIILSVEKSKNLMDMTIGKLKTFENKHIPEGMEIDRSFFKETSESIVWHVTMLNEDGNVRYFYPLIKYKRTNDIALGTEIKEKRITLK